MAIHVSRMSQHEQIFSHIAEDGTVRHFAVERLVSYMQGIGREPWSIWIEPEYALVIAEKRGIEQHRLDRLTDGHLAQPMLYLADVTPGTHLLADGHHRYVRKVLRGDKDLYAYVAEPKLWERFMIEGLPSYDEHELKTMHSNIF